MQKNYRSNTSFKINYNNLNIVLRDKRLHSSARLTLKKIIEYAGRHNSSFPSQATLSLDVGVCDRQIRKNLALLKSCGYIVSWRKRGYSKSNHYTINPALYSEVAYRNHTTEHSGTEVPIYSGITSPPKKYIENKDLNIIEEIKKVFRDGNQNNDDHLELSRVLNLSEEFGADWVLSAIKYVLGKGTFKYIAAGLVTKIIQQWLNAGKRTPRPYFTPCNQLGCQKGYIDTDRSQSEIKLCECLEDFKQKLSQWESS